MNKNNNILYPFSTQLMFAKVMEDRELCRDMLRIIFPDRKVKDIIVHKREVSVSEATVITGMESKSIRLDVLFEDERGWYDIEMHVENRENLPKRSRYYGAALDVNKLKKGRDYNELKPSYIIFICMYDEMKIDEPVYSFRMFDEKYGIPLNDERYTVILNASCSTGKVPERFRPLFEYLKTGEVAGEDDFIEKIDARVREFQDDEEIKHMMSVEDEMRHFYENKYEKKYERDLKEGLEKGLEQAQKQSLEQGLEQGRTEGEASGRAEREIEIARGLKDRGVSIEIIAETSGLSAEEIDKL